jgi:hypothetical protein
MRWRFSVGRVQVISNPPARVSSTRLGPLAFSRSTSANIRSTSPSFACSCSVSRASAYGQSSN